MSWVDDVLHTWFDELEPADWFRVSADVDRMLTERFEAVHHARRGVPPPDEPRGRLAHILVLDQLSRNLYRGTGKAYAWDHEALATARVAVAAGDRVHHTDSAWKFVLMPFMHSEDLSALDEGWPLTVALGLDGHIRAYEDHHAIVRRFRRYPHRNDVLGRASTTAELAWLQDGRRFGQ